MIRFANDGVRWEVQPGFADALEKVLKSEGTPVKTSPAKAVTCHQVDGRLYYVKRYRHTAVPFRRLKYLFKPSQARQEWNLFHALDARRIPAVRHLALGERRTACGVGESILVTEGFDGVPLEEALDTDPHAVLRFVQKMHEAGVLQQDLHPGNLLVRRDPLEIRLVDLHGIRLKPILTAAERERNLARLCVAFPLPVGRHILQMGADLRRRLRHERSGRCLRHNREFAPLRAGGLRWWVRQPALNDAARAICNDPDAFLAGRALLLKPGRSSTVGKADGLVLKRYNLRKAGNLLKDLFRPSKGRRSYRKAYHLELAGIPTARIIATADRRCCGLLLRSYVLMEAIPEAVELGTHLSRAGAVDARLVRQAAALIATLHREGLTHRDLKESNLVLDRSGRLHLLDLDGLEFIDVVPDSRASADLDRFARGMDTYGVVKAAHRRAFLRHYCRTRRIQRVPGHA